MTALAAFLPFFWRQLAINMRLARLVAVPLVGCASHHLNLAVCILLDPHVKELEQAQSLMKRLRTLSQAANLRYVLHYCF
ncbi:hypothetical protein GQ600_12503 [Phytophthora cactorum]|nr:hypothetical protein GQ600_12503 [Phytophthora cactorum]